MDRIGLESPRSAIAHNLDDAMAALESVGLPAIIRPSFTLGGTGGGIAYNRDEFAAIVAGGLEASPTTEVLIEESVLGWKEYEMEVVRDRADNAIIICSIENVDPMGIHTGDSITVAPALTLTDKEYQIMRNASIAVLREIGVETGGSNVQFAVDPKDGRLVVIEMNPRVSRSSALASKATGFPIAKVAAKLAVGYTLDEIQNDITGVTPASFEPTIDYVVTKIPRFAFEKFKGSRGLALDRDEVGRRGDGDRAQLPREPAKGAARPRDRPDRPRRRARALRRAARRRSRPRWRVPAPDRLLVAAQALREGLSVAEVHAITKYDPWFLERIEEIVRVEEDICRDGLPGDADGPAPAEGDGLLRPAAGRAEPQIGQCRRRRGQDPDPLARPDPRRGQGDDRRHHRGGGARACATGSASARCSSGSTPAPPSSRRRRPICIRPTRRRASARPRTRASLSDRKKVVILGGGPNRIGQGIEFDYCCVHAAYALERGRLSRRS